MKCFYLPKIGATTMLYSGKYIKLFTFICETLLIFIYENLSIFRKSPHILLPGYNCHSHNFSFHCNQMDGIVGITDLLRWTTAVYNAVTDFCFYFFHRQKCTTIICVQSCEFHFPLPSKCHLFFPIPDIWFQIMFGDQTIIAPTVNTLAMRLFTPQAHQWYTNMPMIQTRHQIWFNWVLKTLLSSTSTSASRFIRGEKRKAIPYTMAFVL